MNNDDKNDLFTAFLMWGVYWLIVVMVLKGLGV